MEEKWIRKAIVLGTVFFLAIFLVKPVEVTSQFSVLSGMIYYAIDPSIIWEDSQRESGYRSSNVYFDENQGELAGEIMNPIQYDFILALAIPVGGLIAFIVYSRTSKGWERTRKHKRQVTYEEEFIEITKVRCKRLRKCLKDFFAGVLLLYGFRLADVCIKGHVVNGFMQGSISVLLFTGILFAIAIPVAIVSGHKREL